MPKLNKTTRLVLLGIIVASALTHFVGLSYPHQVIFDEVHFGKFVSAYCCTGERFFDIHPPHAKLLIAAAAKLGGYQGGFPFENIGQPYGDVPVFALRVIPALTGILLPLILFALARQLGASLEVATLAAGAAILDNALTVQTRIIALDGVLLVATFGSLSAFLAAVARAGWQQWAYIILAGALAGVAVGTKFTGLAALGLLGVLVFVKLGQASQRSRYAASANNNSVMHWVLVGMVILATAAVVYFAGWALHFYLLPLPGSGDAFHVPTTLLDKHSPYLVNLWQETLKLQRTMLNANYNLQATHPDSSPWWSWPFMVTSVFYWQEAGGTGVVYFLGNPLVWWGVAIAGVSLILSGIIRFGQGRRRRQTADRMQLWIPVVGYVIAMVPLVRVPRALFLYHYLMPLLFALLAGLLWLEREHKLGTTPAARRGRVTLILVLLLVGFIWFSPLTYGMSVTPTIQKLIFWLPSWR